MEHDDITTTRRRTVDWSHELVEQLDWHWQHHVWPRLTTISDDEYLWEPVAGAWSLRRRGEARTPMAAGAADTVADYQYPEPQPAPFTTIAWRMGHIAIGVLGSRAANHFGDGGVDYPTTDWPLTAAGGLALLRGHYDAWLTGVRSLGDDGLARPCGPSEGPWADAPMAALVLHITREVIHHGAEICLLRDLYRARGTWTGDRA
jgi:DinB superfamily